MNPDWEFYAEHLLSPDHAKFLSDLDSLRTTEPILYAMVLRHRTSLSIATSLCYPHETVLHQLRSLKKQDTVYDTQGATSVLWNLADPYHIDLSSFAYQYRRHQLTRE